MYLKKLLWLLILGFSASSLSAKNIYVSPTGVDTNSGLTLALPVKTISTAITKVVAGDSIIVRGGTYTITGNTTISKSGTSTSKYYLYAYQNEVPIFDGSSIAFGTRAFSLSGSYWEIKGLQIKGAGDNGMYVSGSYNRIELCQFYENRDTGLQFGDGASYNNIINCDSYWNADPTDYADADGFAIKMDVGSYNHFYGCRAWMNVDDGWDGYLRGTDNVTNSLENCWVFKNGYKKDGSDPGTQANGNGFKMGGSDEPKLLKHNVTLINCLAFDNKSKGFDQNNNKGNMTIYNGTAYNNLGNNFSIPTELPEGSTAIVKNCADLGKKINLYSGVIQSNNSWLTLTTTSADFISIDPSQATAARKADGSLPDITYMHLSQTSQLIDKGTNLGLPYNGAAPDMGCFESNYLTGLPDVHFNETSNLVIIGQNKAATEIIYNYQASGMIQFAIYNLCGAKVAETANLKGQSESGKINMDLSKLPAGVYLCNMMVTNSEGVKSNVAKAKLILK